MDLKTVSMFNTTSSSITKDVTKTPIVDTTMTIIISTTEQYDEFWLPPAVQFFLGICGNAVALFLLFSSRRHHKWRPFHRLVFCLALTDCCGILLVYPLVMSRYASNFTFEFSNSLCRYYVSFIFTFAPLSSSFIICSMSIDRFIAVLFPLTYRGRNKYKRVNLMLIIQFVLAILISGLHLMGLGDAHAFYPKSWCFFNFVGQDTLNRANSYIYSIVGILTVFMMVLLNSVVIITICRRTRCNAVTGNQHRTDDKNNLKIIIFLFAIVIVFAGLWLPLMTNILMHAAKVLDGQDGSIELLFLRLAVTNAIVDPWIYILLRRETLEWIMHLIRYWRKRCGRPIQRNSDRQSLSDPPQRRDADHAAQTQNNAENIPE